MNEHDVKTCRTCRYGAWSERHKSYQCHGVAETLGGECGYWKSREIKDSELPCNDCVNNRSVSETLACALSSDACYDCLINNYSQHKSGKQEVTTNEQL